VSHCFSDRPVRAPDPPGSVVGQTAAVEVSRPNLLQRIAARIDPSAVRNRVENVNDGILSIAGFSQGLSGGGEVANLWSPVMLLAAFAGALAVASVVLGGSLADWDAEQLVIQEELRQSALEPEQQIAELADYYEGRGVSPATARKVAEELNTADSIGNQLFIEGFDRRTTVGAALTPAIWAALSFLLGACVPILISVVTPGVWRDEYTLLAVAAAVTFTSVVLAKLGHTRIWRTVLRSILIGLAALTSSYFVGSLLL